ncbi:hypothetical protein HJG54_19595 [Leptolyngbya sp. NK1-12]|uniref:Uncharacterized protein n=1 Tax=Leptolyngbya sp. NK1-12 TaxID=2547451 RepID=A0AA96WES9_9CYAN|nr:hypothetical protein [Leptolyngbya sp. NK1-12]WNZ24832.1 hypothetical protein HJG54_19595 [Leptolyngbya sp. NK1-12]
MNSDLTLQRTWERAAARELTGILYALTNNAYGSSAELIAALSSVIEYLEFNFEGNGVEDEAVQLFNDVISMLTKRPIE